MRYVSDAANLSFEPRIGTIGASYVTRICTYGTCRPCSSPATPQEQVATRGNIHEKKDFGSSGRPVLLYSMLDFFFRKQCIVLCCHLDLMIRQR